MPKTTRAIVVHELRKQIPALVSLGALIVFAATVNIITPLLFKALVDGAIPAKDLGQVLWLLVGMVSASLLGIVLSALQNYQRAKVGEAVTQGLRQSLFDHAIRVRLSALEKLKVGEIVHRIKLSCGEWTCPHDRILLVNPFAGPIPGDSRHRVRRRLSRRSGSKAHLPTVS